MKVGRRKTRAATHADRYELALANQPVERRLRDSEQLANRLHRQQRLERRPPRTGRFRVSGRHAGKCGRCAPPRKRAITRGRKRRRNGRTTTTCARRPSSETSSRTTKRSATMPANSPNLGRRTVSRTPRKIAAIYVPYHARNGGRDALVRLLLAAAEPPPAEVDRRGTKTAGARSASAPRGAGSRAGSRRRLV